jgi:hypothetical protein
MRQELLGQQRHEQFAVEPGLGAVVLALGQVAQLHDLFQALKD